MKLTTNFITNIHDVYGESGKQWLEELPNLLDDLAKLWKFNFLRPMSNLTYNFVALVELKTNTRKAILKIAPQSDYIANEVTWLRSIEKGAPTVYLFEKSYNAILMEFLEPGLPLKNLVKAGNDDAATQIIAKTIQVLQSQQHAEKHFQHLSELAKALSILRGHFNAKLLSQAEEWFDELTKDRTTDVVLHGDLHHDNIISSGNEWKAIDPHGYLGDPAAEVGVMIRNPFDCFPTDLPLAKVIERRLRIMAEFLPFDPKRIKAWTFCMTVLSAAWTLEGHRKLSEHEIAVACAINQVKM